MLQMYILYIRCIHCNFETYARDTCIPQITLINNIMDIVNHDRKPMKETECIFC